MNRRTILLAAIPCAIATLAAHGILDAATCGWPVMVAVLIVLTSLSPVVRRQRA